MQYGASSMLRRIGGSILQKRKIKGYIRVLLSLSLMTRKADSDGLDAVC